jgi:hypothetical protein
MAEQFRSDSAGVGALADGLSGLGAAMTGHVSSAREGLAGAGAPWGTDDTGEKFAGGPGGFVAHLQQRFEAMAARAETVAGHADHLAAAGQVFERADDQA